MNPTSDELWFARAYAVGVNALIRVILAGGKRVNKSFK